jgi:hypothetical protein
LNSFKKEYNKEINNNEMKLKMMESFQNRRFKNSENEKIVESKYNGEYINVAIKTEIKFKITVSLIPNLD